MSFQSYLDNIEAKTGKSPDELKTLAVGKSLARAGGLAPGIKAGQVIDWLKADFDLGTVTQWQLSPILKGKEVRYAD